MSFDDSRLADLQLIDDKLHDHTTTKRGIRNLERSKAAILRQERDPRIVELRSRLRGATQTRDTREVHKINEQLQKFDQQSGFDQRQ
jgi:hypothetical protein